MLDVFKCGFTVLVGIILLGKLLNDIKRLLDEKTIKRCLWKGQGKGLVNTSFVSCSDARNNSRI